MLSNLKGKVNEGFLARYAQVKNFVVTWRIIFIAVAIFAAGYAVYHYRYAFIAALILSSVVIGILWYRNMIPLWFVRLLSRVAEKLYINATIKAASRYKWLIILACLKLAVFVIWVFFLAEYDSPVWVLLTIVSGFVALMAIGIILTGRRLYGSMLLIIAIVGALARLMFLYEFSYQTACEVVTNLVYRPGEQHNHVVVDPERRMTLNPAWFSSSSDSSVEVVHMGRNPFTFYASAEADFNLMNRLETPMICEISYHGIGWERLGTTWRREITGRPNCVPAELVEAKLPQCADMPALEDLLSR